jgi:hypothetical protein
MESWMSKKEIVDMVQKDFPKEWEYLMNVVESENKFYYKLKNKIKTPLNIM